MPVKITKAKVINYNKISLISEVDKWFVNNIRYIVATSRALGRVDKYYDELVMRIVANAPRLIDQCKYYKVRVADRSLLHPKEWLHGVANKVLSTAEGISNKDDREFNSISVMSTLLTNLIINLTKEVLMLPVVDNVSSLLMNVGTMAVSLASAINKYTITYSNKTPTTINKSVMVALQSRLKDLGFLATILYDNLDVQNTDPHDVKDIELVHPRWLNIYESAEDFDIPGNEMYHGVTEVVHNKLSDLTDFISIHDDVYTWLNHISNQPMYHGGLVNTYQSMVTMGILARKDISPPSGADYTHSTLMMLADINDMKEQIYKKRSVYLTTPWAADILSIANRIAALGIMMDIGVVTRGTILPLMLTAADSQFKTGDLAADALLSCIGLAEILSAAVAAPFLRKSSLSTTTLKDGLRSVQPSFINMFTTSYINNRRKKNGTRRNDSAGSKDTVKNK